MPGGRWLILCVLLAAPVTSAGSENDPELQDAEGDGEHAYVDFVKAWVQPQEALGFHLVVVDAPAEGDPCVPSVLQHSLRFSILDENGTRLDQGSPSGLVLMAEMKCMGTAAQWRFTLSSADGRRPIEGQVEGSHFSFAIPWDAPEFGLVDHGGAATLAGLFALDTWTFGGPGSEAPIALGERVPEQGFGRPLQLRPAANLTSTIGPEVTDLDEGLGALDIQSIDFTNRAGGIDVMVRLGDDPRADVSLCSQTPLRYNVLFTLVSPDGAPHGKEKALETRLDCDLDDTRLVWTFWAGTHDDLAWELEPRAGRFLENGFMLRIDPDDPALGTPADLEGWRLQSPWAYVWTQNSLGRLWHDSAPDVGVGREFVATAVATTADESALQEATALVLGVAVLVGLAVGVGRALARIGRFRLFALLIGPLFTRLERDEVLSNQRRAALVQAIDEAPGTTFGELRRRLKLSSGSLLHHLTVLVRQGFVRRVKEGFRTHFFIPGSRVTVATYLTQTQATVLEAVARRPGIIQKHLSAMTGLPRQSLNYHAGRLARKGQLEVRREGRVAHYYTPHGLVTSARAK